MHMDIGQRLSQTKEVLRREEQHLAPYDVTAGMDPQTMKRFIDYLLEQQRDLTLEIKAIRKLMEESEADKKNLAERLEKALAKLDEIGDELKKSMKEAAKERRRADKFEELYKREKAARYGNGQKNTPKSNGNSGRQVKEGGQGKSDGHDVPDRQEERDNHDGTGDGTVAENPQETPDKDKATRLKESAALTSKKNADMSNRPANYNGMDYGGEAVFHPSDRTKTGEPLDVNVIRLFKLKTIIEAHDFEMVKVRKWVEDPETGRKYRTTKWIYEPCEGHPDTVPAFEGTHATPEFMQALAYEIYMKGTTFGSLHRQLTDMGMSISKSTLNRWLRKGKKRLDKVVAILKNIAVEKDSVLNCDETWCKVRRYDKYRKCYLWVIVNREEKIVIFFYDNGSRGSKVLQDFLGEAEIKCLVTDGYVGYKFIDKKLEHWGKIDHVVCWAHIHSKFVEAIEAGCNDPVAAKILECINSLFKMEEEYKKDELLPEEIAKRRQSQETECIVTRLKAYMLSETSVEDEYRSPLYQTALTYLKNNWDNAIKYLDDGRYPIDNNTSERNVRPFCARRNSFEHFGSDEGAEMAACYHSVIGTLVTKGASVWDGLGKIFSKVIDKVEDVLGLLAPPGTVCTS